MNNPEEYSRHSGSIRVTWAECPNKLCPSRNFEYWNVDYHGDSFCCGTCETPLERPLFFPNATGRWEEILCAKCREFIPEKRFKGG